MKFSYRWLREMVDGLDTAPRDLERLITLKTAECERIEDVAGDSVIEVDNKSLTHRPDLWGHYGMAGEVAAITRKSLCDPVKRALPIGDPAVEVEVQDFALCPRYSALTFENVRVQPSPAWLQSRLEAVGLNAINNIVDVTNFIMAELAQPMHAFDADKLRGGKILVRRAHNGERLAALNGETYDLDFANLVIADPEGAIALAGVIGGADSAISEGTTRIVLESACFNASNVRKTSSRLKLRTDASIRFEKSQDPRNTVRGLRRAIELLEEVSPGIRIVGGAADAWLETPLPQPIELPLDWLARKLGRAIETSEVRRILESLEFGVSESAPGILLVTIPSWRATKDVSIKDDLVEEVGRMIGYGSIMPVAPLAPAKVPPANPERAFHRKVRAMAAAQGFTEVYNYSFLSIEMIRSFGLDPAQCLEVANPMQADQNLLRPSLLPGILKNVHDNVRYFDAFRLFEIGREIHPDQERPHFAAAIYAKDDGIAGLMELKRLAQCFFPGLSVRPSVARSFEHPQRAAEVLDGEVQVGHLAEFHPRMIETGRAAFLDLDLSILQGLAAGGRSYHPLRRFPTSSFDVSAVVESRTTIASVESRLKEAAGGALVSIAFVRQFLRPDGRRSLTFHLTFGADDRTLTSEEIQKLVQTILASPGLEFTA